MNRPVLRLASAVIACLILSACGKESTEVAHKPHPFHEHDRCHICGMAILRYEGPKSEIFIKNVEEPVKFCSVRDGFTFALQPENQRRLEAFFVHDMGSAQWEKPQDSALVNARDAYFVYGSKILGVMGDEPIPFADEKAAEAFARENGGRVLRFKDITLNLLAN